MEELRKLEEVQRMLTLVESRGFASYSDEHSNRFLANFLLLLIQPCGDLDINKKCSLIRENLPKISAPFLEEALLLLDRKGSVQVDNNPIGHKQSCFENVSMPSIDRKEERSLRKNFEDMALVSLDSMQRANSTLEDFCRSYFMFHRMHVDRPQSIFKFLPMLSFTESYIYQMDSLNEKMVNMPMSEVEFVERGYDVEANKSWTVELLDVLETNPFGPLVSQLELHGLLTERIKEEFKCGEEYWALERKLCSAFTKQKDISVENVMRAIHLKSFDYRILNLLLYQLIGEQVDDLHMEFLSVSEFLVEVSDDLFDYEDDVVENNFNILRMFVKIYGPSSAPAMLATYIAEAEEKYDNLLKTLDPQLALNYQKRCEEATEEGGKICGHPLGTWNIPPVIVDEDTYRLNWLNSI